MHPAAIEAEHPVNVVPATNAEVAGHVTVCVLSSEVDAAYVRAMGEDASETKAPPVIEDSAPTGEGYDGQFDQQTEEVSAVQIDDTILFLENHSLDSL